jgi:streptogramin lyase
MVVSSSSARAAVGDITEYPIPAAGSFPLAIAAGPDGNIWITEMALGLGSTVPDTLFKVTTLGVFTAYPFPAVHTEPVGMVKGPDLNLWITETIKDKVAKATTSGVFTDYTLPTAGGAPRGITVGFDGNLWVSEFWGNKIARVTTLGAITEFAIPTAGSGPAQIVLGSDGNVWFVESQTAINKVAKITTSGAITEYFIPTPLSGPGGIAAGPDGNLWITEGAANKIARITTVGVFTEFAIPTANSGAGAITAGPDGNLWFTEGTANKVARVTTSGVITEFPITTPNSGATDIAPGTDGSVWFLEQGVNKVGKVVAVAATTSPPVVTTQPVDQSVTAGGTATFMAAASGTPAPTVQWQVSTNGGVSFADLVGATSTTLTIPSTTVALSGNRYRAVFTNTAGVATSNAAILTVNPAPVAPVVTTQPVNQTVTAGATAIFMAAASGTPAPTVQWQVSTNGGISFADLVGATSTTLTIPSTTVAMSGNKYRAVFTNTAGVATSSAATLTVNTAVNGPTVTSVSPDAGVANCSGMRIRIRGTHFTGATSVHFGSKPAVFRVRSDGLIVAIAPAAPAGTVDVTVTTPAGTSPTSSAARFTYRPQDKDEHRAGHHQFDVEVEGDC